MHASTCKQIVKYPSVPSSMHGLSAEVNHDLSVGGVS